MHRELATVDAPVASPGHLPKRPPAGATDLNESPRVVPAHATSGTYGELVGASAAASPGSSEHASFLARQAAPTVVRLEPT
jgi:hypothetical protein